MYDVDNQWSQDRIENWYGTADTPELLVLDRDVDIPERMCVVCNTAFKYYQECLQCGCVSCDACQTWRHHTKRRKDFKMRLYQIFCPVCETYIDTLY